MMRVFIGIEGDTGDNGDQRDNECRQTAEGKQRAPLLSPEGVSEPGYILVTWSSWIMIDYSL